MPSTAATGTADRLLTDGKIKKGQAGYELNRPFNEYSNEELMEIAIGTSKYGNQIKELIPRMTPSKVTMVNGKEFPEDYYVDYDDLHIYQVDKDSGLSKKGSLKFTPQTIPYFSDNMWNFLSALESEIKTNKLPTPTIYSGLRGFRSNFGSWGKALQNYTASDHMSGNAIDVVTDGFGREANEAGQKLFEYLKSDKGNALLKAHNLRVYYHAAPGGGLHLDIARASPGFEGAIFADRQVGNPSTAYRIK